MPRKQTNIAMNGYLFTAAVTRTPSHLASLGPGRTTCHSSIVCADNAEEARKRFEAWLCAQPEGESRIETRINRIAAAQFIAQLLTEKEFAPMDWPQIAKDAQTNLEAIPADDFEQGYWVDVNAVVGPSSSFEALREALPEDIRSGLNWAEDKQFLFLLSVLSPPPPPPPDPADEPPAGVPDDAPPGQETAGESAPDLEELEADFPELVDKEVAVLIRSRNSAVAAWLWRKYAADTKLADHQIRIDPWCGLLGLEAKGEPGR